MYHNPYFLAMLARERQQRIQHEAEQRSLATEARAFKRANADASKVGRHRRRRRFADITIALRRVARPAT
jgi:hypothetical protein